MPGPDVPDMTPEQKEILNKLLNDNPKIKNILKTNNICEDIDDCDVDTIISKTEDVANTAQIWNQIDNLNQQGNNANQENAFIKNIRDRYDKVMYDIQGIQSVTQSVDSNYGDKPETEKIFREMSSERIRLNNSEKIRLMVWGVATVGIFLITFNKLRK